MSVEPALTHPLCLIPALVPGSPARPAETSPGLVTWLRPERSFVRDGLLLLHHWVSIHPEDPLNYALMESLKRTALRLEKILAPPRPDVPTPPFDALNWPEPGRLRFTLGDNPQQHRRLLAMKRLRNGETLELIRTPTSTSLLLQIP